YAQAFRISFHVCWPPWWCVCQKRLWKYLHSCEHLCFGRLFHEAWGKEAPRMQEEFNDFLEKNHISISMELVTAVLGDHGQRPKDDYAVITAVTELGHGKPKFYSTPETFFVHTR
ncbi:hypothetical protein E2562_020821, partial [Oryza meyeriana var. granulata]